MVIVRPKLSSFRVVGFTFLAVIDPWVEFIRQVGLMGTGSTSSTSSTTLDSMSYSILSIRILL